MPQSQADFIPCRWQPGFIPSQKVVEFSIQENTYSVLVDEDDVRDSPGQEDQDGMRPGLLRVYLIDQEEDSALVDLPQETPAGRRFFVPPQLLHSFSG